MKRFFIRLSAIVLTLGLISCGGKQEEQTKTIPSSAVKIVGDCSNFFTVSGESVKIILTNVEDSEYGWEVRAVIPFAKTSEAKSWKELKALPHIKKGNYAGMMGFSECRAETKFLDTNETEIDLDLKAVGIEELLKAEESAYENITIQYTWEHHRSNYEKAKAKYDKVSGIKFDINMVFGEQFSDEEPAVVVENNAGQYVIIDANDLRLRKGPSLDAEIYKKMDGKNLHVNKGECYQYLDESNGFYKIDYRGDEVWVSKDYTYLSDNCIEEIDDSDNDSDSYNISNTNSSSKNEWDQVLDEYEKYVDQYIKFYKKAMNGDMSAMSEYVNLLEKAEKISDQLKDAQGDMTNAQMKRYLSITQKMSNALLDD